MLASSPSRRGGYAQRVKAYPIRVLGDPVLKQRSREVEELDGTLATLVDTMYTTMYDAVGLGLAAPQVGVRKRLFTYDVGEGPRVLINPEVVETSGEAGFEEGCLSIPGLRFEVQRPERVTVRGIGLDGREQVFEDDDMLARVFQHELDHLDGILLIDRLDPDTRKLALRELREIDLTAAALAERGSGDGPRL